MECAQLQITGGGSTSPATVSFPGAYSGKYSVHRHLLVSSPTSLVAPVFQEMTPESRSTSTKPSLLTLFPVPPYSPALGALLLLLPPLRPWFPVLVLPRSLVAHLLRHLLLRALRELVRRRSMLSVEVRLRLNHNVDKF